MIPVVIIVSIIVFTIIMVLPGDPAMMMLGDAGTNDPSSYYALRAQLGLDRPLPVQYLDWVSHVVRGDFGTSLRDHLPIGQAIAERVAPTLELAILALIIAIPLAITVGVISALKPGSIADMVATVFALSGVSFPSFFLGILLIEILAVNLHWLAPSGYAPPWQDLGANLRLMIMPAITLASVPTAVLMRHSRSALIEVLQQEYMVTARAKGLPAQAVVIGHAMRNSLIPVVTIIGLETGSLIGGVVIIESIFSIPGMGRLLVDSITFRDYPTVQAMVLLLSLTVLIANLLADLTYGVLDPRVRYGARSRA